MREDRAAKTIYLLSKIIRTFYWIQIRDIKKLREAERKYGRVIICANHTFRMDGPILASITRSWQQIKAGHYVGSWAKASLFDLPLTGKIFHDSKTAIPLSRKPGCLTNEVMDKTKELIDKHGAMLIFIQGSTRHGNDRKPKTGPVRAAIHSDATIIPVSISPFKNISFWRIWLHGGITIAFGDAIKLPKAPESFEAKKRFYRKHTDNIWKVILKLSRR